MRTALHLLDRMADLNERLRQRKDATLIARIAVHSDLAIVRETSSPGETLSIVGPVLPLVSQLEHLAAPNTVLISDDAHQLVKDFFECTGLGTRSSRAREARSRSIASTRNWLWAIAWTRPAPRDRRHSLAGTGKSPCWKNAGTRRRKAWARLSCWSAKPASASPGWFRP